MSEKNILLICTCCGAECGVRDQAHGRCGNCGSFFTGAEVVVESAEPIEPVNEKAAPPSVPSESPETSPSAGPEPDVGTDVVDLSSEKLVTPRKLSPQFRRHIEMTWQPALSDGGMGAQRTISRESSNEGTKRDSFWQSIGTRRVAPVKDPAGGDYELQDVIGEGSMGRVWSARQTSLDRNVAVKVPRPELAGTGSVGESQFISEVVVTGKLEHPNIVPIYELGRDTNGIPFYSMKHVQGRPWNELIAEKSEAENIEILMKVCDAIAFAHDRDFLHRDIKPHNVMVGEFGEVSVMDWGIAVSLSNDSSRAWAAVASGPAGTPAYMAPEMAAHNPTDLGVVSDVYLLGAVLYEIVTGLPPHPCFGDTNEALLAAAANEIISTRRTGELVDIARRAMATKLDDRYQSVKEFQDALREYQSHRQSIVLAESADQHLATAEAEGSSDEFARSRFAYEEALKLWPANTHAAQGLRRATIAHAKNALKQENFELGIAILDAGNPDHHELLSRLHTKRAARRRLASFSKIAATVAVGAILMVAVVYYRALEQSKDDFEKLSKISKKNNELYKAQISLTETQKKLNASLNAQQEELVTANESLNVQRKRAMAAQADERKAKIEAKKSSYVSEIGIAAASIRRNEFPKAVATLESLANADPIVSKLRHIEWGILQHAANPPVTDLLREEAVASVASSASGDVIAAGTEDGRLLVWFRNAGPDAAEDRNRQGLEARHGTRIHSIAMSETGHFVATAGVDDRQTGDERFVVRIWSTAGGQVREIQTLRGHTAEVLSVVFSDGDAQYVLSSGADRTAIKWDRGLGKPLTTIRDHLEKRVWSARFAPGDSDQIVTACDDARVRVWRMTGGDPTKVADFRGHLGPVYAAVFSRDGQTVFSGGYGRRLLRWEIAKHRVTEQRGDVNALLEGPKVDATDAFLVGTDEQQHESSIRSLAVRLIGDTECILSGGNDNTVRVWTDSSGAWQLAKILRGHGRWIRDCMFTDEGTRVVSGAFDGVKLWDWQDYSMPRELYRNPEGRIGNEASELGLSPATEAVYSKDGRWIATAYQNGLVAVWNAVSGDKMPSALLGDGHDFLTASGTLYDQGARLLTSAGDNTTRLWSVDRGTQTLRLSGTGWRGAAAVHKNSDVGTTLVVTGSDERLIPAWLWRIENDRVISRQPLLEDFAQSILVRTTMSMDNELDTEQLDQIRRLKRRIPDVTSIAFSDSGDRFLIGNAVGLCFVFQVDAESGDVQPLTNFSAHGSSVRAAVFLPSGDSVITASTDGQISLWNATDGNLQRQLPESTPVTSLALSRSGDHLLVGHSPISGSTAPVARLMDLSRSEPVVAALPVVSGNHDWSTNPPTVQSARFDDDNERAVLSLFFPDRKNASERSLEDRSTPQSSYQLGYWDWEQKETGFRPLEVATQGEISSATIHHGPRGTRLLVVGGKGARLLASNREGSFRQLTASFRSAAAITAIGFSHDPDTNTSTRLVTGDVDGNVRVWELEGGKWSESVGAAVQLTGHHVSPVVAADFDPRSSDYMLTADRSGRWIRWKYDGNQWLPESQLDAQLDGQAANCALYSPDGTKIFLGADDHAVIWRQANPAVPDAAYQLDGRWETGPVRTATFSRDGKWIVTSDGDRFIRFWNADGTLIAEHADEDTKDLTTLDLSWDRRRLFTGHQDERVVIWDTSKLVDTDRTEVKVLLTLEEHQRGVTSVAVSPNGRHLLSADQEGRTIIAAGEAIVPISLSLTRDQATYRPDSGAMIVDPWIALSDPSRLADFSDARLRVFVTADSEPDNSLPQGTLALGTLDSGGPDSTEIVLPLDGTFDADGLQSLLRGLTYQIETTGSDQDRPALAGALAPAVSGQPDEDEQMEEITTVTRTLTIELSGIKYLSESVQTSENSGVLAEQDLPTQLRANIQIEIESTQDVTTRQFVLLRNPGVIEAAADRQLRPFAHSE